MDLANAADVDMLFSDARPDYVMHLASCVTGRREIEWIRETMSGNLQTAVNVLVAAQEAGVEKTVLAGSPDSIFVREISSAATPDSITSNSMSFPSTYINRSVPSS